MPPNIKMIEEEEDEVLAADSEAPSTARNCAGCASDETFEAAVTDALSSVVSSSETSRKSESPSADMIVRNVVSSFWTNVLDCEEEEEEEEEAEEEELVVVGVSVPVDMEQSPIRPLNSAERISSVLLELSE